jgi:hypothetical protein
MPIFKIDKKQAKQLGLKPDGFGNEFELRDFFADNLEEMKPSGSHLNETIRVTS